MNRLNSRQEKEQQRKKRAARNLLQKIHAGSLAFLSDTAIQEDLKNIRQALQFCASTNEVDLLHEMLQGVLVLLNQRGSWDAAAAQIQTYVDALPEDTANGTALLRYDLGQLYEANSQDQHAAAAYQKSLILAQSQHNRNLQAGAIHRLGWLAHKTLAYETAQKHYQEAQLIWEKCPEPEKTIGLSRSQHHFGILAQDQGNFSEAEQSFQRSLKLRQAFGDPWMESASIHHLGVLKEEQKDLNAAESYHSEALNLRRTIYNRPGEAKSLYHLARVYSNLGLLDQAENQALNSEYIRIAIGDRQGRAITTYLRAEIALKRAQKMGNQDLTKAQEYFETALRTAESCADLQTAAKAAYQLGVMAENKDDSLTARLYYEKSIAFFSSLENTELWQARIRYLLGKLEIDQHNYQTARHQLEKSANLLKSKPNAGLMAQIFYEYGIIALAQNNDLEAEECFLHSAHLFSSLNNPARQKAALTIVQELHSQKLNATTGIG